MKWIILGAASQIGRSIQDILRYSGQPFIALSSKALDITNIDLLDNILYQTLPRVIINCASYHPRNSSEKEWVTSNSVNVSAPEQLAYWCQKNNAWLIQLSPDLVFSHHNNTSQFNASYETDSPNPTSHYGRVRRLGELAVANNCSRHIVVRHGWTFCKYNQDFINKISSRKINKIQPYKLFTHSKNPIFNPTYAPDLAHSIIQLATLAIAGAISSGYFHYAGHSSISQLDFQNKILSMINNLETESTSHTQKRLQEKSYPSENFSLNTEKIQRLGIRPSYWEKGLKAVINENTHFYCH